jgi:cell division cycle 14
MGQYIDAFTSTKKFRCFQPQTVIFYQPYCDDFGPMNCASVVRFIEMLDHELVSYPSCKIMYCVEAGRRALTNAAFLMGAYMILKLKMTTEGVSVAFSWLDQSMIEPFRDVTFSAVDFGLTLKDCWRGLERGIANEWLNMPSEPGMWGMIDIDEYIHLDDPLNADLNQVVPGKFVAFRGPRSLGDREYSDDDGCRRFSAKYYIELFHQMGVTDVIRLNEPEYDWSDFEASGINHFDLHFEDCTCPSTTIVEQFLKIADKAKGMVAVHCKAGLGRTGTLIAVYLMRRLGFSAREAMGWLRIMRPGSVIGEQQHFLSGLENPEAGKAIVSSDKRNLAAQVEAGMDRRCAVAKTGCSLEMIRAMAGVVLG